MCKAPKVKAPKPNGSKKERPEWLRNPYLDGAIGQSSTVNQLRAGRSSLRIDLNTGLGIRNPASPTPPTPSPRNPTPRPVRPISAPYRAPAVRSPLDLRRVQLY